MHDIRLRRVKRSRVMTNVLRAQENSVGEILEKHAWLHQTRDGFETKAANRAHLFIDFAQLRNAVMRKIQARPGLEIFLARVRLLRRLKCCADSLPNAMFVRGVRRVRYLIPWSIIQC